MDIQEKTGSIQGFDLGHSIVRGWCVGGQDSHCW